MDYLRIYKRILQINFARILIYRDSFYGSLISALCWGGFQVIWIMVLTNQTKIVFGWNRHELIILAAAYTVCMGFCHMFFSRNFDELSRTINLAKLDSILTKPVDSQFLISTQYVNYANGIRSVAGIIFIIFYLNLNRINYSWINIFSFFILLFLGTIIIYSIWLFFCSFIIWFPRLSNIVDLLYNVNGFARYPSEMIKNVGNVFLYSLLPLTIAVAIPTRAIFSKLIWGDLFELIFFTVVLFYISRKFWQFALRYYTSAS